MSVEPRDGPMGPMTIPKPLNAKEKKFAKPDDRDVGTPDEWIHRHPELVRLTGKHPFNVEPPLPSLMANGFITPSALHYVRNHGAPPKLTFEGHRLSVSGHVANPITFTMADLLAMPARELPVTLVCAGNRRKEENLVQQTIGFNWGAAGVGTSVWKGVLLRDVLLKCGIKKPDQGANHVCFLGVESMPKGRYGTSITYYAAMDPACDVMLAYEQNGEPLAPDHGYPLRLIIPGYIGGRMIKWLSEITVTTEESDNFFHFNDNRVLPEHVTAEIANAEGWWYKPDFIINELNINSAIAYPGHLEVVPLQKKTYPVQGYAYNGGGRKVIRVEVSTDGGKTWTLSNLNHPEEPTEYGRYWCWCFWRLDVPIMELYSCETPEILCRAWDASMNRQPDHITWNVMGMMNNSYFRIKVHRVLDDKGMPALKFQHPTLAGPGNFGGWFEDAGGVGGALSGSTAAAPFVFTRPAAPVAAAPAVDISDGPPVTLAKGKFIKLPLKERTDASSDTRVFRFALPTDKHILGLPVGQHLFIKLKSAAGETVMRAYTPMGCGEGYVDFVIKVYFANVHPRFPDGGKLTQLLDKLQVGDTIEVKGPLGEYIFNTSLTVPKAKSEPATFTQTVEKTETAFDSIGFIAGGSGITPVLQVCHQLVADKNAKVRIKILFANRTTEDILCKDLLDKLEADERVDVWYTLDVPPESGWRYSSGFINEEMVREHLPTPAERTVIFMCGPPPMINFACKPNLAKVGHAESNMHCF